ncbi:heparan-alpha-glucosaminide N-acetyltransferase domain-containing protein [Kineococcus sp. SYSU DK002]|uniref:heparan-alpha-glucosaminide N-acetyltransferase domain-containing protein n=1 Tax=Kineococcus sp. SYSU DK002 TaxID=3383123 RepID=UPI003D7D0DB0
MTRSPDRAPARGPAAERVTGVDLARAAAVVGMMAIHVLPGEEAPGAGGVLYALAHGRASGLFAVLAGVSLGLATRRAASPAQRRGARAGVVVRGLLVALVGLLLVDAGSRVAVILPYYGVAFAVVLPFLWWPARRLAVVAVGWLALAPLVSFAVRAAQDLQPRYEQPTLGWLGRPGDLLEALTLTGYYPVVGWAGYLLLGLAVSRVDLRSPRAALGVLGAGAAAAAAAWAGSALLLGPGGGRAVLDGVAGPSAVDLARFYGTVPTDSRWWLAVVSPHSGTPFDLLHTGGTALAVLGAACLLPAAVTRFLHPVAAVGAMPLTVYTAHVLALAGTDDQSTGLLAAHVAGALVFATLWRRVVGRGPLELVVGRTAAAAAAAVAGRPAPVG